MRKAGKNLTKSEDDVILRHTCVVGAECCSVLLDDGIRAVLGSNRNAPDEERGSVQDCIMC